MRLIAQIKGANGSGKTTIMKQLIDLAGDCYYLLRDDYNLYDLKGKPYATVLYNLKWIIMGHYPKTAKGGGCDNIHKVDHMKAILDDLHASYSPNYSIVFEGAMISSTMTLYYHIRDMHDVTARAVLLRASLEGCIRRLEHRKGIKLTLDSFNHVEDKCLRIFRQDHLYIANHIRSIDVDNIAEEEMVYEFLDVVG